MRLQDAKVESRIGTGSTRRVDALSETVWNMTERKLTRLVPLRRTAQRHTATHNEASVRHRLSAASRLQIDILKLELDQYQPLERLHTGQVGDSCDRSDPWDCFSS